MTAKRSWIAVGGKCPYDGGYCDELCFDAEHCRFDPKLNHAHESKLT